MTNFKIQVVLSAVAAIFIVHHSAVDAAALPYASQDNGFSEKSRDLTTSTPQPQQSPEPENHPSVSLLSEESSKPTTFFLPTALPEEPKATTDSPAEPTPVRPLSPKGRSLIYRGPLSNVVVLSPMPDNSQIDYPEPILTYKPSDVSYYDYIPEVQYDPVIVPEPINNMRRTHFAVYPSDNLAEGDMATAESNIVFRPLFSYRRQTAQRRRVYSRSPASTSSSSSSSSSNRNEQRGSQGYPYRYPSYGYPNYYPSYYHNAQFDTVP